MHAYVRIKGYLWSCCVTEGLKGTCGPAWSCCVTEGLVFGLRDEALTALLFFHHIQRLNHSVAVGGADERHTDVL